MLSGRGAQPGLVSVGVASLGSVAHGAAGELQLEAGGVVAGVQPRSVAEGRG